MIKDGMPRVLVTESNSIHASQLVAFSISFGSSVRLKVYQNRLQDSEHEICRRSVKRSQPWYLYICTCITCTSVYIVVVRYVNYYMMFGSLHNDYRMDGLEVMTLFEGYSGINKVYMRGW